MRRIRESVVGVLAAIALIVGITAPAQAALSECSSGNECLWQGTTYTGLIRQNANYMDFTWPDTFNDTADSAASYGNINCAIFYENVGYSGQYIYFSRPALGGTYRDPTLSNGGGYGPYSGQNWANRISSANWTTC